MQKIKIYINTLPVSVKSGGMKIFLLKLLDAFASQENNAFEYYLICSANNKNIFFHYTKNSSFQIVDSGINNTMSLTRIFFEQFRLNRLLKNQQNAFLLNICNVAVLKCSVPQVTILQAPLSIPSLRKTLPGKYVSLSFMHRIYYNLLVIKSLKISEKTITVSQFVKTFLPENGKIEVIYEGVDTSHFFAKKSFINTHKQPYILAVNTLFPYKNTDKIIRAYSIFKRKGHNHKLIIAGRDPDQKQLPLLKKIARDENVEEFVEFVGMVPHDEMPGLYQNASLFLFLSAVETFGLPVLEAMSSGVPVIASDRMSIPEVVRNAGILVNPDDIEDIALKIETVLTSEQKQQEMIAAGKENIRFFDWNTTAENFKKIFFEVAAKNNKQ